MNDKLLSYKELADYLGRSEWYVYTMRRLGLKVYGGRVSVRDALDFIALHPQPVKEFREKKGSVQSST